MSAGEATKLPGSLDELAALQPADLANHIQALRRRAGREEGARAFNLGIEVAFLSSLHDRQVRLFRHDEEGARLLLDTAKMLRMLRKKEA